MMILAHDDFNRTEAQATGWTKINAYGDGTMEADAGRAKVNKGASTPPLMRWDASVGTAGGYKFTVVPTTYSRMNVFLHMTNTENYIMLYVSGATLGCSSLINSVQKNYGTITGAPITQGDSIAVETVVTGVFTRHIILNIYVNGEYVDYFILDKNEAIGNGACGIQFENIAESHFDDALLEKELDLS